MNDHHATRHLLQPFLTLLLAQQVVDIFFTSQLCHQSTLYQQTAEHKKTQGPGNQTYELVFQYECILDFAKQ